MFTNIFADSYTLTAKATDNNGVTAPVVAGNSTVDLNSIAKRYGRIPVGARYSITRRGEIGFAVAQYDKSKQLVIDPIVSYSTYLGGSEDDDAQGIAVDSNGNAYIVGTTISTDFPMNAAFQRRLSGNDDIFITKLNSTGTSVIFSTYLGGRLHENNGAIAVDSAGNAYVTGTTNSSAFPVTSGAYQTSNDAVNSGDSISFVSKFSPAGTLLYSTYLNYARSTAIASDSSGNAYVTGSAYTGFNTTPGAYQTTKGAFSSGFLLKLDAAGTSPVFSTFIAGASPYGIAVNASGNAYLTGVANSGFSTLNAYQASPISGDDAFVAKFNTAGSQIDYATFLGGADTDYANGIAIDGSGSAYVVGRTRSTDFPQVNSFYPPQSDGSPFIAKLSPAGNSLIYASAMPGGSWGLDVSAYSVAVDRYGNAYVAGRAVDMPQVDPAEPPLATSSFAPFLAKVIPDGSRLAFAMSIGTFQSAGGTAYGVATDLAGNAYVAGQIENKADNSLPASAGAFQPLSALSVSWGNYHAFVMKVDRASPLPILFSSANPASSGQSVVLTAEVDNDTPNATVTFSDGLTNLGSAPVVNGKAMLPVTFPPGIHAIGANFSVGGTSARVLYQIVTTTAVCH